MRAVFFFCWAALVVGVACLAQAQVPSSGAGKGAPGGGAAALTWDNAHKGTGITLSNGNIDASKTTTGWTFVVATSSVSTGKYYCEIKIQTGTSFFDVGMTATNYSGLDFELGASGTSGWSNFGFDIRGTGGDGIQVQGSFSKSADILTPTATNGDVIGFAVDNDAGKLWLAKNNDYTVFSTGADPAGGGHPAMTFTANTALLMATSLYAGDPTVTARLLAGGSLTYSAPSGFTGCS